MQGKKLFVLVLLGSLSLAFADIKTIEAPKYPQDLVILATKGLDNPEDATTGTELTSKIHEMFMKKFEQEAKQNKLSKDKYLDNKKSIDNFMTYLNTVSDEKFTEKLSPENLLILSIEVGLRFQLQQSVRFPDLGKLEKAEKILQEKLMPKISAVIENRKKGKRLQNEMGFCTPNNDQSICETPDGRIYKLDTSANQLQRTFKKLESGSGENSTINSNKAVSK